jgi:hypothetical protein
VTTAGLAIEPSTGTPPGRRRRGRGHCQPGLRAVPAISAGAPGQGSFSLVGHNEPSVEPHAFRACGDVDSDHRVLQGLPGLALSAATLLRQRFMRRNAGATRVHMSRSTVSGMAQLHVTVLIAASVAGCLPMTQINASSRSYLGPEQSGAVTTRSVGDTAREVTRLFEVRGFAMIDQHVDAPDGELRLKFTKGNRALAAEKDDRQVIGVADVGSVFYAWVKPAPGGSTVSLLGKPTLAGVEPCTSDGVILMCEPLTAVPSFAGTYLSGRAEAEIAHGVLSQLALEGYAVGPMPASAPPPTRDAAVDACKAQRHQILLRAVAEQDPETRHRLLHSVPHC